MLATYAGKQLCDVVNYELSFQNQKCMGANWDWSINCHQQTIQIVENKLNLFFFEWIYHYHGYTISMKESLNFRN